MSLIHDFLAKQAEADSLAKAMDEMKQDPEFAREIAFRDQLLALMETSGKDASDVLRLIDPQGEQRPSGTRRGRKPRSLKVYRNPLTGEVVETRGGNHTVLKAWKAEHGKDTVEGWVEKVIPQAA